MTGRRLSLVRVIPAKAGISAGKIAAGLHEAPAFAGVTA
jgi:hypothetical protein